MRCIIRWTTERPEPSRNQRLEKLHRVLEQAAASGYYRRRDVILPECTPTKEYLTDCLDSVPRVDLQDFLMDPVDFFNWNHKARPLRPLDCPLRHTGRTAVFLDGFEESPAARTFVYHTLDELEEFEPESLAGPVERLRKLAEASINGQLRLDSLESAIIAFTGLKHGILTMADRETLWRAFQIPVFEQFRGFSMELLAWECEAHDGLHIHTDNAIFESQPDGELVLTCLDCTEYALLRVGTELAARIVMAPCGCGDPSPRLVGLRAKQTQRMAVSAGMRHPE